MTWKEFKDKVESLGVKDEDKIDYIDVHDYTEDVCVRRHAHEGPFGEEVEIYD